MTRLFSRTVAQVAATAVSIWLAGCGGGASQDTMAQTQAAQSDIAAAPPVAGVTPFIAFIALSGRNLDLATSFNVVIAPRPGSASKPVSVTWSIAYLIRRGYAHAGSTAVTLPVFGLYAGATNDIALTLAFADGSTRAMPLRATTAPFVDDILDHPQIVQARPAGSALGFDFFYLKTRLGSPAVVDTDGQLRWVGATVPGTLSSTYFEGGFVLGSNTSRQIYRLEFDGSLDASAALDASTVQEFHHDIEPGKTGLIDNVDVLDAGVLQVESVAQEFMPDGQVLQQWDLGQILSGYMAANGDDPTQFVRPGIDWFHMNTAIYDPRDDSVIVSSRENFIVKIDYFTGAIRWIFGDTSKYWYTFPSLRAKSLAFVGDGLVPVGQHGVTIAPDGNLMVFNNGTASSSQPAGAPAGLSRAYAAVSSYAIDEAARTVTEQWHFDDDRSTASAYCSSARQLADGSLLVDYAYVDDGSATILMGLDAQHRVAFSYRYTTQGCSTAWNAQPIGLEAMVFD